MSSTNGAEESVVRPSVPSGSQMAVNEGKWRRKRRGERERERKETRDVWPLCARCSGNNVPENDTEIINKHIHGTTWAIRGGNSLWVIFPHAFRLFFHCATLPPPPSLPRCQSHSATTFLLPGLFTIAVAAAPLTAQCAQRQTCRRPHNPATFVILESSRTSADRHALNAMIHCNDPNAIPPPNQYQLEKYSNSTNR